MNQGVEWAVHVLLSLAWVDNDRPVSTAALAASYDLPPAYPHKQMQALARASQMIADVKAEADAHAPSAARIARKAYGRD
ncbi:transcriptional regulator [Lentzea flaviverrucosa]|uniref:Transcriptional regulator n=2 Tax=Lentzea flaviverrucosa TaxID=200379 RepID=A0A1H9A6Z4_9PSEU|nr:transcriptional regulator [Lentzea flaviverrucosa]SEP72301.1 Transcriptional regulator [Lentzea flaviverrucosa]